MKGRGLRILCFAAVLPVLVVLLSCGSAGIKKELTEMADSLMLSLVGGNYADIPEMEQAVKNLDPEVLGQLESELAGIRSWKIKIDLQSDYKASAGVTAERNGKPFVIVFSYTKRDTGWELDSRISMSRSIEFIPLIEKVEQ